MDILGNSVIYYRKVSILYFCAAKQRHTIYLLGNGLRLKQLVNQSDPHNSAKAKWHCQDKSEMTSTSRMTLTKWIISKIVSLTHWFKLEMGFNTQNNEGRQEEHFRKPPTLTPSNEAMIKAKLSWIEKTGLKAIILIS